MSPISAWGPIVSPNLATSAASSATVAAAGSPVREKPVLVSWHHTQSHIWCHCWAAPTWLTMLHTEQRRRNQDRPHCQHRQNPGPRSDASLGRRHSGQGTSMAFASTNRMLSSRGPARPGRGRPVSLP